MDLSVVVPIHNEEANINILYRDLTTVLTAETLDYEIILINDGSRDDSAAIIDTIADEDGRVLAVHFQGNFGQTAAMAAGFDMANGEIIVAIDADNQNDPEDIPRLIQKIRDGYDVVSGWRRQRKDRAITRILPSKLANWLISKISGVRLHDYGCSLKAYSRKVIKGIRLYGEMHRFIPIYCSWQGARVTEIEVNHRARFHGQSHYGLERVVSVVLDLIVIRFLEKHMQHPIHFFGRFGLLNFLLAFATVMLMVYYKFWGDKSFIDTPLPILAVLFITMGAMAIFVGIVAEMVMRTYYESQKKMTYQVDDPKRDCR